MFRAIAQALGDLTDKRFRRVVWRSIAITVAALIALGAVGHYALAAIPRFHWGWLNAGIDILGNLGLVIGSVVLAFPVASLVIGLFVDEIAAAVETTHYPADPPGKTPGVLPTIVTTLTFLLGVLLVNLIALPLYFIPGPNLLFFLLANGYLFGREYFELAAFRHGTMKDAARLRRRHWLGVWLCGIVIALALMVPILNLLAPLFGTALMVHFVKTVEPKHAAPPTSA